jgi:hypothetical protein
MGVRFGLIGAIAVAIMGGVTGTAEAQVVTVGNWNWISSNPNSIPANMPTINPTGKWTVPPPALNVTQNWKVVLTYGTLVNGVFTPDATNSIGTGLAFKFTASNVGGVITNSGAYSWAVPGDTLLLTFKQLPANSAAQISLQYQDPKTLKYGPKGSPVYLDLN